MSLYFRKNFDSDRRIDESQTHINREIDAKFRRIQALGLALAILKSVDHKPPLFELGHIAATPGALDLFDRTGINVNELLMRHVVGDWGDLSEHDAKLNDQALQHEDRILSVYKLGPKKETLWLITEYDRSATTALLPEEY